VLSIWIGIALLLTVPAGMFVVLVAVHFHIRWIYLHNMVRIFQEKPLFNIPRGQPADGAEAVTLTTSDGLKLKAGYFKAPGKRKGVVLFGLEFGSNRWSCLPYCEHLLADGFDVFTFEPRNQGESDCQPGYDPLQWVTEFDVRDVKAALAYLKSRSDADPRGIGFFGISKGASAGLMTFARDPFVRCAVTDGMFAAYTTLVPYMRQWFRIYNSYYSLQGLLPSWYYGILGKVGMGWVEQERNCRFLHLEKIVAQRLPVPLLMIHGGGDTYIKPAMAKALFELICGPKEFWLLKGAKHNQALQVAPDEYRSRVLSFFNTHLAARPAPLRNGLGGAIPSGDETRTDPGATHLTRNPLPIQQPGMRHP
jgi:pimeloyl-ACP methyl ester carboxylesterase